MQDLVLVSLQKRISESNMQGEPRASHDVDIVINITPFSIPPLIKAFPSSQYYLSEKSIHEVIAHKSMFNLLDTTEGDKIDFWMLSDDAYDQSRFARKTEEMVFGSKNENFKTRRHYIDEIAVGRNERWK